MKHWTMLALGLLAAGHAAAANDLAGNYTCKNGLKFQIANVSKDASGAHAVKLTLRGHHYLLIEKTANDKTSYLGDGLNWTPDKAGILVKDGVVAGTACAIPWLPFL